MIDYVFLYFFFFNDTATTEIYTLSLHDALPISTSVVARKEWAMIVGSNAYKKRAPSAATSPISSRPNKNNNNPPNADTNMNGRRAQNKTLSAPFSAMMMLPRCHSGSPLPLSICDACAVFG